MQSNNLKYLKITLYAGAVYYLIGALAHYFDLTIFPWYDARLRAPYHDLLIAVAALTFAMFLIVIARNPLKNIDTLKVVLAGAIIASIFSIAVAWKVNFAALGAPDKKLQTIVEGILGLIFSGFVILFFPKEN